MSGADNMAFDCETLRRVGDNQQQPTLRFFRFKEPTASYGRLQTLDYLSSKIPSGWPAVRRPTGGGMVLHDNDLCFSLVWRRGEPPVPSRFRDQYRWIHDIVLNALKPLAPGTSMATCRDCAPAAEAFETRECFTAPVVFDLILNKTKILGGALRHERAASLYQGSVQGFPPDVVEPLLHTAFEQVLTESSPRQVSGRGLHLIILHEQTC